MVYKCRIKIMYNHFNERSGLKASLIDDDVYEIIMKVLRSSLIFLLFYTQILVFAVDVN